MMLEQVAPFVKTNKLRRGPLRQNCANSRTIHYIEDDTNIFLFETVRLSKHKCNRAPLLLENRVTREFSKCVAQGKQAHS